MRDDLHAAIDEALDALIAATGRDVDALFGDRVLGDFDGVSATAARAAGIIEGAAIAMGMTALELLDELGLPETAWRVRAPEYPSDRGARARGRTVRTRHHAGARRSASRGRRHARYRSN